MNTNTLNLTTKFSIQKFTKIAEAIIYEDSLRDQYNEFN
jgi:hypothetical protein